MTSHFEVAVKSILLPTESIKVVLETAVASPPGSSTRSDEVSPGLIQEKDKRILAVISHTHVSQSKELGCLFILKPKLSLPKGSIDDPVVEHVIPIGGDFSLSTAQAKHGINSRHLSTVLASNQLHSKFVITIKPNQSDDSTTLVTNDIQQLRSVLLECRRLKQLADVHIRSTTSSTSLTESQYSWILPYISSRSSMFSATPSDIRVSRHHLIDRLSPAHAGFSGNDASDTQHIRDEWLLRTARELCNQNGSKSDLRIRIGTFNVNGKMPNQDLSPWVQGDQDDYLEKIMPPSNKLSSLSLEDNVQKQEVHFTKTLNISSENPSSTENRQAASVPQIIENPAFRIDQSPDLLVLAFQELDLSTEALMYLTTTREDAWIRAILAGLGEKAHLYEKLASKQLIGMLLIIIVKKDIKHCFRGITTCSVGAGIMGFVGNKGGTAIRITYHPPLASGRHSVPTILTFVNSHLAAFDESVDRRNADFHDLSRRLWFQHSEMEDDRVYGGHAVDASVFHTDVLFWMGDLNYRIDLPSEDIRNLLTWPGSLERNFRELLKFDQLNNAVSQGYAFEGFIEYPISHLPSYRFSSEYATDELGYDMKRKPAWTDRILHMNSLYTTMQQLSYKSHPEITMSDHRPVSAEFVLSSDSLDLGEYEKILRKLDGNVHGMEDLENGPTAVVDPLSIDFGQVRYRQTTSKSLVVRNPKNIPCAFRFVSLESNKPIHPMWLRVNPMTGLLLSEQAVTIDVVVEIDNKAASTLNVSHGRLEFVLILHTEFGKDHFIFLSAQYEPTCFANSLSRLNRLSGPVRTVKSSEHFLSEVGATDTPKEIMRLVNWMMTASFDMNLLFTSSSDQLLVDMIRECLDTGQEFSFPAEIEIEIIAIAFAETLVQLLDSLTESIIPGSLHMQCIEASNKDGAYGVLDLLPPAHLNVWMSITAFLHYIVQHSDTEIRVKRGKGLAAIFGPIFLRGDKHGPDIVSPVAKLRFLLFFIL